ncbi:AT-rich interactive domain-containing protein 3A-like isoform X2 [Coregonus clupeaformis]|uniref:AT-rich interactive domain-containing protein 3A-like isoform X2 n=1 Tax=Coregonus clupeaformis TaxID=59861 RepID=UPI001BDFAFC1|nr:AT-rich interactive domain-containing protein 3A-like isoform X2 [Coregonus clupeaformis]
MVDNTSIATKSASQAAFSSSSNLPLLVSSASTHSHLPGSHSQSHQPNSGGMKLEAVMENLQRQQAARLALEEKLRQAEKEKDLRSMVESQIHQQALAFHHYQAAVRGALAAGVANSSPSLARSAEQGLAVPHSFDARRHSERADDSDMDDDREGMDRCMDDDERNLDGDDMDNEGVVDDENEEDMEGALSHYQPRHPMHPGAGHSPKGTPVQFMSRIPPSFAAPRQLESPGGMAPQSQHHEWTYEEQFKQLYELDNDDKRKEFLDDLFSFMQKRGTPVNRIPIMAKQVLDLYTLYKLVTDKGGLVEVINKKIWREITKGLNLPTSITSAAFTLRTQYMKYLYPYECEKRGLSSPGELQAAIDSNRREGRRQSYGSAIFNYSPAGTPSILSSPKMSMPHLAMSTYSGEHLTRGHNIKKEDGLMAGCLSGRVGGTPMSMGGHPQVVAAQAAQAAALEQLREKLESGEPPEKKKMMMMEQQRLMQHALQQNLLAMATQLPMNIKINDRTERMRDDRQEAPLNLSTAGISSINMSIEINGVVYTGVLFARKPSLPTMLVGHQAQNQNHTFSQGKTSPGLNSSSVQIQPSCSSSSSSSSTSSVHGHGNSSP